MGCQCRNCDPGLTRVAPAPDLHSIDAEDLQLLMRLGLAEQARQIAAGTCPMCGLSRASRQHRERCEAPVSQLRAPTPIRQPWDVRPARRLRAA